MIKRIEYYPSGTVKSIEYWPVMAAPVHVPVAPWNPYTHPGIPWTVGGSTSGEVPRYSSGGEPKEYHVYSGHEKLNLS